LSDARTVTNGEFIRALFGADPGNVAIASFKESPNSTAARWGGEIVPIAGDIKLPVAFNNYFGTAVVKLNRDTQNFVRLAVLVFDDVQADESKLPTTYKLETSAGNFQIGYAIEDSPESRDVIHVKRFIKALIAANVMAPDKSGNNPVRWVRLPRGSNTKDGGSFRTALREWHPERRYTLRQVLEAYGVSLDAVAETAKPKPKVERVHDLATQIDTLRTGGAGVHDAQVSVGMRLINSGMNAHEALAFLDALVVDDGSERLIARRADNERIIESAVAKLADEALRAPKVADDEPPRFPFIPDHLSIDRPKLEWFVGEPGHYILPKAQLVMVFGPSGSGKSFWAYDLLAAAAQGKTYRGIRTQKCKVAWLVAEGQGGMRNRKLAYASANGGAFPGFIDCHISPDLMQTSDAAELIRCLKLAQGCDILVIDTLSAASPESDEGSKDMGLILKHAAAIHDVIGCMVFVIHHSGKNPLAGARGSYKLTAACDAIFEIEDRGTSRVATITKMNDADTGAVLPFRLATVPFDDGGEQASSCVVEHIFSQPVLPKKAKQKLSPIQQAVYDSLIESAGLNDDRVAVEIVKSATLQKLVCNDEKRDTRPQRIARAIEALATSGRIKIEGSTICLS
jgi:hypothetical protein